MKVSMLSHVVVEVTDWRSVFPFELSPEILTEGQRLAGKHDRVQTQWAVGRFGKQKVVVMSYERWTSKYIFGRLQKMKVTETVMFPIVPPMKVKVTG